MMNEQQNWIDPIKTQEQENDMPILKGKWKIQIKKKRVKDYEAEIRMGA